MRHLWRPRASSLASPFGAANDPLGGSAPEFWVIGVCIGYFGLASLIALIGSPAPGIPAYLAARFVGGFGLMAAGILPVLAWRVLRRESRTRERVGAGIGTVLMRILTALCVLLFLGAFSAVKNAMAVVAPFSWDPVLADLDAALHMGWDAWRLYAPVAAVVRPDWLQIVYMPIWLSMSALLPLCVLLVERDGRERGRFFVCLFVVWIGIGNVLAFLMLSGGPAFYDQLTGEARFAPLMEWLRAPDASLNLTLQAQEWLWNAHASGDPFIGSGISAMPSVHVGMATITALYLGRRAGWVGWAIGLAYLAAIQFGSVLLGWHYAIDGYVSIAVVCAAWRLASPAGLGKRLPLRAVTTLTLKPSRSQTFPWEIRGAGSRR